MCKSAAQVVGSLLNSAAPLCEFSQISPHLSDALDLSSISTAPKIFFLSLTRCASVTYNTFSPFHRLYGYDDL
jgi:hypothetical protein